MVRERTFPIASLINGQLAQVSKKYLLGTYIARSKNMTTPPRRKKAPEIC